VRDPFSIDLAPMVAEPKQLLERDVQKTCVAYATRHGWHARKYNSQSQRSVPDFLFSKVLKSGERIVYVGNVVVLGGDRYKLAVEFKKLGEISTEKQWLEQYEMWLHGWDVRECDNFEKFKRIIDEIEARYA
jgi:nuclear transport factor 2 (NTF2) superfamily protein